MTEMRDKIARAIDDALPESDRLTLAPSQIRRAADAVLALIGPVMEENERLRSLVRKHVTFAGRKFPESVAEEARAALSPKSETLLEIQQAGANAKALGASIFDNPYLKSDALPANSGDTPEQWEAKRLNWEIGYRAEELMRDG
jgi:hypothetical protein